MFESRAFEIPTEIREIPTEVWVALAKHESANLAPKDMAVNALRNTVEPVVTASASTRLNVADRARCWRSAHDAGKLPNLSKKFWIPCDTRL